MIETRRAPVILMYHSVRETANGGPWGIEIAPERFERHIDFVTSHYRVVPLVEFINALSSRTRMEGLAAITFDDAFADNLGAAADILRKYSAPATVFVPTGFIGRPYYWWDALPLLWSVGPERIAADEEFRARFPDLALAAQRNGGDMGKAQWDRLRRLPHNEAYQLIEGLAARFGVTLENLPRPATEKELPRYARWPFEAGSHGISHRVLPSLLEDELRDEIQSSRLYLEQRVGRMAPVFSYPFGQADRVVAAACLAAAYAGAVTVANPTDINFSYANPFALPRLDVGCGDFDDLVAKLDRFEEANGHTYTAAKPAVPTPTEVSPERRSLVSSVDPSALVDPQLRGGDLFRTSPVAREWGWRRGTPLDRPFIDQFIRTHAGDVRGRILEIKEPVYASKYARPGAKIEILDIEPANKNANIIDDLQTCASIADNTYDCVILTQALQYIPDFARAIANVARILRPGGVLLLTAPGVTQAIADGGYDPLWSFLESGFKHMLAAHFDARRLLLRSHGNAGLAASFLMGLVVSDVPAELFSVEDREYPIVVTARAMKPLPVPDELEWNEAPANPRVSIIIPMYNAERTIKETLCSVSRQSFESYEILIVDDGSTDGSRLLADELASRSKGRITVLEHAGRVNLGLALTRNRSIDRSRGEFVVFLDSDDTIHPEKLAHDVAVLEAHPEAAAVVGRALWWWDGAGEQNAFMEAILEPHDRVIDPPTFFNETYVLQAGGFPPCVHSWMVRKTALAEIEPFDPEMMTYEDQKFLAELSLRFPIYVASACLCEYRRKETSLWTKAVTSGTDLIARSRFLEWKDKVRRTSPSLGGGGPSGPPIRVELAAETGAHKNANSDSTLRPPPPAAATDQFKLLLDESARLADTGEFNGGIEALRVAQTLRPDSHRPAMLRAKLEFRRGQPKSALAAISEAFGRATAEERTALAQLAASIGSADDFLSSRWASDWGPKLTSATSPFTHAGIILLVKDEDDIIGANLEHHYAIGFRLFSIIDNQSSDKTAEIVRSFRENHTDALVLYAYDQIRSYYQSDKMRAFSDLLVSYSEIARRKMDWVFFIDADEFIAYVGPAGGEGRIASLLADSAKSLLPLLLLDCASEQTIVSKSEIVNPFETFPLVQGTMTEPWPKVAVRCHSGLYPTMGNHFVQSFPRGLDQMGLLSSYDWYLFHFSTRSVAQVRSKTIKGHQAFSETEELEGYGVHWRQYYDEYSRDGDAALERIVREHIQYVRESLMGIGH